jgi:hypothetical protein
MIGVLDPATIEFFHGGCALLVGTVEESGMPHAGRGHGLTVVTAVPLRVRLLIDTEDARTAANLRNDAHVAICTADVLTFRSLQLKGRVVSIEPATADDEAKHRQYAHDFTNDINRADGDPMEMMLRWTDRPVTACVVDVDETFDQTPGPSAGQRLGDEP